MMARKRAHLTEIVSREEFLRRKMLRSIDDLIEVASQLPDTALLHLNSELKNGPEWTESYQVVYLLGVIAGAVGGDKIGNLRVFLSAVRRNNELLLKLSTRDYIGVNRKFGRPWGI